MTCVKLAAAALGLSMLAPCFAAPVNSAFTAGAISGGGFPEPSNGNRGAITASGGSGGGSTGGGVDQASMSLSLTSNAGETLINFTGSASHSNPNGFTGVGTAQYIATTGNGNGAPIIWQLNEPATFFVTSAAGSFVPTFSALTGAITGDPTSGGSLVPGTYQFAINMQATQGAPLSVNWTLHVLAVPAPGAAAGLLGVAAFCARRRRV